MQPFRIESSSESNTTKLHKAQQIKPRHLPLYLLIKGLLVANGSIESNTMLMAHWTDTKLGLLPRVLLSKQAWISLTLSLLLPRWPLLRLCLLFLLWEVGIWFSLMWTMPSSMVIFMKRFASRFSQQGEHLIRGLHTNLRKMLTAKFFSSSTDEDYETSWLQNLTLYKHSSFLWWINYLISQVN